MSNKNSNYYLDIIVINNKNEIIPIELKYKTFNLKTTINLNGFEEAYILKNHDATDIGKYLFLKDINRIEFLKQNNLNIKKGYVIFLTNEEKY